MMTFYEQCDEFNQLRKIFIQLDESNDGQLSVDEIYNGLVKVLGQVKGNKKKYQLLIEQLDSNGNGVIDYSEFLTAAINKTKLLSTQNLEKAFKMFDTDNSGTISIEELKEVFMTQNN